MAGLRIYCADRNKGIQECKNPIAQGDLGWIFAITVKVLNSYPGNKNSGLTTGAFRIPKGTYGILRCARRRERFRFLFFADAAGPQGEDTLDAGYRRN